MSGIAIASGIGLQTLISQPSDIDGLQLWLDATYINQEDNTAVSTWEDKSGNGYDATQSTSANQPVFKKNIINGKPSILFDGVNDTLSVPSSTSIFKFLHSTNSTIFLVCQAGLIASPELNMAFIHTATSPSGIGINVRYEDSGVNEDRLSQNIYYGTSGFVVSSNQTLSNTFPANQFNYANIVSKPSNATPSERSAIQINNGTIRKGNGDTNTPVTSNSTLNLTLGGYTGAFLNGYISEILIYNKALTSGEIASIHNYIKSKWDL